MKNCFKNKARKIITCFLALCMIAGMFPFAAITASAETARETCAPYDEITVSDLTGSSSFDFSNTNTTYRYTPTVDNNSKVFRFNLTRHSGAAIEISMNNGDQRFKMDSTHTYLTGNGSDQALNFTWLKDTAIEVEFGCKLITSGANNGKDYVYVKANGQLQLYVYTEHKTQYMNQLLFVGNSVTISDVEPYDEITVSDLTGSSSFDFSNTDTVYNYTPTVNNNSKVFRFYLTRHSSAAIQISMNNGDQRFKMDSTHTYLTGNGSDQTLNFTWLKDTAIEVEFGCKLVATGTNAGKDHVYIKANGELQLEVYTEHKTEYMNQLLFEGSNVTISDVAIAGPVLVRPYALYDEITVSDLTGSSSFDFSNTDTVYNYTPTVNNNSKVFRFNLVRASNSAIEISMNNGDQRFQMDSNHTYFVCDGSTKTVDFTWTKGQNFEVEFGCKLVTSGENNGMDYVYVKVDGKLQAEAYTSHKTDYMNQLLFKGSNVTIGDFMPYDEITVSDLTGSSSFDFSNTDTVYNYTSKVDNNTKVFRFNLVRASSAAIEISMNNGDQRFKMDSTHTYLTGNGSDQTFDFTWVKGQSFGVEFGCKLVTIGANAGKDHVYIKVDGKLQLEVYTEHKTDYMNQFLFVGSNATISDYEEPDEPEEPEEPEEPAVEETYAPYDEITVSDLTGGASSFTIANLSATLVPYLPTVDNNTKVFKFNLVPASGVAVQIGLDGYNQRFEITGQNEFLLKGDTKDFQGFTWNVGQSYKIELGCKLVTAGENTGKDYVYLKIDGTLYKETYTAHRTENMNNVLLYGSNATISDVDDIESRFDTYDVISLNDLGLSDGTIPSGTYTFNGVSRTGSKVFEFDYNHNQDSVPANMVIGFNGWNRRMQVYNTSQILLFTEGNGTHEAYDNLGIAANVDHRIKYGNIRILSGDNAGKDLQFVYLDGKLIGHRIADPLPVLNTVMIYSDSEDGTVETFKNASLSSYDYVNIDNEKRLYFVGKSIVAPASEENGFVGWKCGEELYPAGAEMSVSGNVELTSVSDLYFLMDEEATARLYNGIDGLRFTSRLDTSDYATLEDFIDEKGTIIAPTSNFEDDEEFTVDKLANNTAGGLVKVVNNFVSEDDDDNYVWMGTLGNIKDENLSRDFAARGYLKVVYSDDTFKYIYTDVAKYSMYEALCDFYESSTDETLKNKALSYLNTVADIVISGSDISISENAKGNFEGQTVSFTEGAIVFSGTNNFKSAVINGEGMTAGKSFEYNGKHYYVTDVSGSNIYIGEILPPTLRANSYGYGISWNAMDGVTEYAVNDSNDYRNEITFAANAQELPDGVSYENGVYTYVPFVVGKHDVSVTVTNSNGSAVSNTISTEEVKPVYTYWGSRNGLYYVTADKLSELGLSTSDCEQSGDYYLAYRTADGWSGNANDRVGTDNNAARRAKDLANLKAMGANVVFIENNGGVFNNDTNWSISNLKKIMDDAWGMGMKVVVCDSVVYESSKNATSQSGANTLISNRLADNAQAHNYMMHPAFYGWTLVDEPTYQTVDGSLKYTVNALKTVAQNNGIEDYLFVSALLPAQGRSSIYGSVEEGQRITGSSELEVMYKYYVKKYLEVTGTDYFIFDLYTPYRSEGISQTSFIDTYTILTELMQEDGLENIQIGQALTAYTDVAGGLVPADVMFSAAAAMANGIDFISWFAYYPHYVYGEFAQTAVDYDGNPTSIYYAVQKATEAFNNMRPVIDGFKTTYFNNDTNNRITTEITDGTSTYHWYLNFNNTQGTAKNVTKTVNAGTQYYLFDATTNDYGTLMTQETTGVVTLAPGAAILVLG